MLPVKLVLIDPDIYFAQEFISKLNVLGHVETHHFLSFQEAFIDVADIEPDLIFTEYELKDKSGETIVTELQQRSPLSKVVMLSKQTNVAAIEAVYKAGVYKYLNKETLLVSQIEGLLNSTIDINQAESLRSVALQ